LNKRVIITAKLQCCLISALDRVCADYEMERYELAKSRERGIVRVKHILWNILYNDIHLTYWGIAKLFGLKSHQSIRYGVLECDYHKDSNKLEQKLYENLRNYFIEIRDNQNGQS